MATSSCIKCGSTNFEIKENSPKGSNYKFMFIQCSSCGGVISVMDYYNIGKLLEILGKKLGVNVHG
ncbi:hypothetical protein D3C72_1303410 [compost metagenome]